MSDISKFVVCPECEGEGYRSKLGAFGALDMDEWFGDDFDERDDFVAEYTRRGGAYDEPCPLCKGQRVTTPREVADWEDEADMRHEMAMEARYGC